MARSEQRTIILIAVIIAIFVAWFGLTWIAGHFANGQTTTEPQATTAEPAVAVDPSTVIATTGIIGAGTAIVNSVLNQRKQNKNVRGTDLDVYKYIKLNNTVWATLANNKDKTPDQVLNMPVDDDPKALDKSTFREALAKEEREWTDFIDQEYLYKK